MSVLSWVAQLVWFYLPAGLANMAPVLMHKRWLALARPIDGGRKLFGQYVFGEHKTWRGLIVATLFGGALFIVQKGLATIWPWFQQLSPYDYDLFPWWFGPAFAASAIIGDLIKSFFKRRLRIAPGKSWFPFDQLDFYIAATICLSVFVRVDALTWLVVISLGPSLHILINRIAYHLGLKNTPW